MQLKTVQVTDFRCIEDSTQFSVKQVTCLVGKNESGKTGILKALYKLKPENGAERFVPSNDFPRRKWRPSESVADVAVIHTKWELSDSEYAELEGRFGKGTLATRTVKVSNGYDNQRKYELEVNEEAIVKHLLSEAQLTSDELKSLAGVADVQALRKALDNVAARTTSQETLLAKLSKDFPKGGELAVIHALDELLPTFLYFDQYLRLPGTVAVDALTQRISSSQTTDEDRIFLALLNLAGTTLERLQEARTFEELNASLRAVSNRVSDQIFAYWSQNRHLDVDLRLDHARPDDPAPFNNGYVFRTRIDNRRHRADTSFDDRSSGFVWFFSFLVWFFQLRNSYKKNLVILLDEPGLALHARAQADLLRYINEQLRPEYQVIYTTHSPFMIDPDDILAARTVEDVVSTDRKTKEEKLLGTKVGEDVLSIDPDTISPLQRALDYEMTQTLFVGRHTLLVEGPSDLLYLKWFSRQLERAGRAGLDYRWSISIVGGVDRIPGFVSLFRGNNLQVAAIVDVQGGDKQKLEKAGKALAEKHLFPLSDYVGAKEADIEDLLGRDFYCGLVNKAYELLGSQSLPTKDMPTSERVAKDVETAFAVMPPTVGDFNHFVPAEFLYQDEDFGKTLPGFAEATERMAKLIDALNGLLH